jgi:membrane protein insertase Oxa1/YidC/SpoIIIJ
VNPWTSLVDLLQQWMRSVADHVGGPGVAIALTTFVVRAGLIPITLPAARASLAHSRVARRIRPQVKEIHHRFKDDPSGLTRELRAVHRANGIRVIDLAGLVAAAVQLPILIAFFQAVMEISRDSPLATGGVVPGLVAAVLSTLGTWLGGQAREARWMLFLSAVLPAVIATWLGAGIGLYLAGFYAAALIQAGLMRRAARPPDAST